MSDFKECSCKGQRTLFLPVHKGCKRNEETGRFETEGKLVAYAEVTDDEFSRSVLVYLKLHYHKGYAYTWHEKRKRALHSIVAEHYLGPRPKDKMADHIDRDKLNDVHTNFRYANRQVSSANSNEYKNNTSGFRGVTWDNRVGKWQAHVTVNGKMKSLGLYLDKKDAARAVNIAYQKYFPDVAIPNDVPDPLRKPKKDLSRGSSTGLLGVSINVLKSGKIRWKANMKLNGKQIHLGTFNTKEEASMAVRNGLLLYYPDRPLPNGV